MEYELYKKQVIDALLLDAGFTFKKSLGQNFITDKNVCPRMAEYSADQKTGVLEIGPGIGVLTAELAKNAKKVVTVELDKRLKPVLEKTLADFNNVEIIFGDVMKLDLNKIIKEKFFDCEKVTVCANLPYYITSPVIMMLLESRLPVESIVVMVQKEAAERLCAEIPGRNVGAVTLATAFYAESEILFNVGRGSFTPPPKVDSAVICLKIRKTSPVTVKSEKNMFRLIRAAFNHRRKTLVNSVSACFVADKQTVLDAVEKAGLKETVRAEELTLNQFAALSDEIMQTNGN